MATEEFSQEQKNCCSMQYFFAPKAQKDSTALWTFCFTERSVVGIRNMLLSRVYFSMETQTFHISIEQVVIIDFIRGASIPRGQGEFFYLN